MKEIEAIIKNKILDVYDGDINITSALKANGADQVTLYKNEENINLKDYNVFKRPYGAILEAADCVADVCFLDNRAIKVLIAMYPSTPKYVLLRISLQRSWILGSIGLIRRLLLGLVKIEGVVKISDINGKGSKWLLLKQKGMSSQKPPVLPANIGVVKFLKWLNAENINYLVLRFYEKLPELYREAGDIDILLSNKDKVRVRNYLEDNKHLSAGVSKDIRLGLHAASGEEGTIPYYPPLLAKQMLDNAVDGPAGSRIPCPRDALLSFIYHALYHAKKGYAAGIPSKFKKLTEKHPENNYIGVIKAMAKVVNVSPGNTMEELDNFLASEGWRPKLDTLAKLADTNAWVYDRFFSIGQGGPVGLSVFILREWVHEQNLIDRAVKIIEKNGFKIIRKKVLSEEEKKLASETLRGGSWGNNPDGSTIGWLPAVTLVVVDMKCVKMPPTYAKGYEHYKIRTLKNSLRSQFDMEDKGSVHSTDNSHESWEYIEVCFPGEVDAVKREFQALAHVSILSKLKQFLSPTYIKHSLRYSVREYMIRKFLT